MNTLLSLALVCLAQDDPVAKLKAEKDPEKARRILFEGLDTSLVQGLRAFAEDRYADAELHLGRAAVLARPYSAEYSAMLARLLLLMRQRLREEVDALIKGIQADLRASRIPKIARTGILAVSFKAALDDLEKRLKDLKPDTVDAERAKFLKFGAIPGNGCATCKGVGESTCTACREGAVMATCGGCAGKSVTSCAVCEGKMRCDHPGFVGRIRFDIEREIRERVGKKVRVFPPQVILWTLSACAGTGSFSLSADSTPKAGGGGGNVTKTMTCKEVWKELKRWAFNGKAKIEVAVAGGSFEKLTPEAARRFFQDFEDCDGGRVPCDTCKKKGTVPCITCGGKGQRWAACSACGGVGGIPCATCSFTGDTAWIAKAVPAERGPGDALVRHRDALTAWLDEQNRVRALRGSLVARLKALRADLDATAKLTETAVNLACRTCKGKSSTCEECWGVGRREYPVGTPEFEQYNNAARVEAQIERVNQDLKKPAPQPDLRIKEALARTEPVKPTEKPPDKKVDSKSTGGVSNLDVSTLPSDLRDKVKKADQLYSEGLEHLKKAKESSDEQVWIPESKDALRKLRESQGIYAGIQEECDARGIDIPKGILERYRLNLQALVMARRQAP